ncbi:HAUS augmin-like complex subunit 6 isoform X2 [Chroicocephalus ridibundus]|uniref:HAUS augmin-like complex subunit 6 isoform X2 n=1 Tax=Chroicocephalus ridibundus TaxID=1192867 RepID=UPI002FDE0663
MAGASLPRSGQQWLFSGTDPRPRSSSGTDPRPRSSSGTDPRPRSSSGTDPRPRSSSGTHPRLYSPHTVPRPSCVPERVPRTGLSALHAKWEGEHLWLCLRALGFDPKAVDSGVEVGPTMFKKPNITGFHTVALFLFAKLDQFRAAEVFCCLPVGREFKKQCCLWLEDIAKEDKSGIPKFPASTLVFPTGPKFIHLMYRFARHTVVVDMKRNSLGTGIPFAEAVNLTPEDMYMASARCRVAYNKLLQIFQKEDFVMREYNKKKQMKQNDQSKNDKTERIQKVRSMWTLIMEILTSLAKEKETVDYVLEGRVGQYVLDGANVVFKIPWVLSHRVESGVHHRWSGNVYEGENLNFLTVIQLLNEALRTLRDEICQSKLTPQLDYIENIAMGCTEELQNLKAIRRKLEQQRCMSGSERISREQEDWEVKWKSFLDRCPLNLMLEMDPVLPLRASPPHSFHPAEDDEDSIFYQHLVSVSDVCDSVCEVHYEKDDKALKTAMDKPTQVSRWTSSVPLELSTACENRDVLIEKNLPIETCEGEKTPMPPKILKNGNDESAISETSENAGDHVVQTMSPVKKEDPLKRARDELAEEFARTVMSESPQSGEGKRMALEDLLSTLAFNPFLTRKQIPRTPENLLSEIRSSWRKAVQTEGSSVGELPPAEVMIDEVPMDATPVMQKAADSGFVCSIPASPVPESDPLLSERKTQLSSTVLTPQGQMRVSHIIESPILETAGMQDSERTEEQELKCIVNISVQNVNSVEDPEQSSQYVKKSVNAPDICSENNSRINVLPSGYFQRSLMDRMLNQNVSPLLSSASHLQILGETFPEELGNMGTRKSASSDSGFNVVGIADITGGSEDNGDIQESKLDLHSLLSPHTALKKTVSRSEEELHQTHNGDESLSSRSDQSLTPERRERDKFCLDEAFTKVPSPVSLNERKYSLSSLLVSCQHLEEMASMVHDIPLGIVAQLKNIEQLNKEPDTMEPSSGQNL